MADFDMTRLLLPRLWHIRQSPLAHRTVTAAICQWSHNQPLHELPTLVILFFGELAKVCCPFLWLWQCTHWLCHHWHIASVTERCANEIDAESKQNPPDLGNRFTHQWKRILYSP
jgi:hypothetical protein